MTDESQAGPDSAADETEAPYRSRRHELAERLQTADNYLRIARRLLNGDALGYATVSEVIDKAIEQLEYAEAVFHQLRRDG